MALPRVFSIPSGAPFLRTFVQSLLAGAIVPGVSRDAGAFALADTTIYVPTRRAARALLSEFAGIVDHGASILPDIRPLGAVDEDAERFSHAADLAVSLEPDLPEAIGDLRRRLILSDLVLAWSQTLRRAAFEAGAEPSIVGATPADAFALAEDLAGLIDEFIVEGAPWSAVRDLVADDYDRYWSMTTQFLQIAVERWPEILAERGLIDAAERRVLLIDREIARLAGANGPTIVLGSTGTNRATGLLMRAIARLPQGAIVLPGLDFDMRDIDWAIVSGVDGRPPAFGHPQAALARLMRTLDCERRDVVEIGARTRALTDRMHFVSQAMAPEDSTANWRPYRQGRDGEIATALADVALIEAPDERTEALAIAIRLREALETPGATAALVTPDRSIARRVQAELRRWDVDIDDSGGETLSQTLAGVFSRAALIAALETRDAALAAVLGHPGVAPAHDRAETERLAGLLEIGVLRATPHDPDWMRRIACARGDARDRHAHPAARRIADADWREMARLLAALADAFAPLTALTQGSLAQWIGAHRDCLARLSARRDETSGEDDAALANLFDEIAAAVATDSHAMALTLDEYLALFDRFASAVIVRGPRKSHARLKILGLLEARLIGADLIVVAGLDETVWPPQPKSDAFLNRPMRAQIGLTPPERRIGQTAHDFWMAVGTTRVVLTRARKRAGAPTVASRFLQRMIALADDCFDAVRARGDAFVALARQIDAPRVSRVLARPAPRPPLDLRPDRLSVTRIEVLRRDPYAIYAEHILELAPLGPLDATLDAAEQGSAVHAALHEIVKRWPTGELPADARDILLAAAREKLKDFFANRQWEAFRWPRVVAGLDYVLRYEHDRRPALQIVHGEMRGALDLALEDGTSFRLTAIADRIEIDRDGRLRMVDYKTGVAPSGPQIKAGLVLQLTLQAAIAAQGGFEALGARETESALYLKLGGGDGGKRVDVAQKDAPLRDLIENHWKQLQEMLDSWREPSRGYASRPLVQFASRFGDYDHLARVKEWSVSGGGSEE